MNISFDTIILYVRDVEKLRSFYSGILKLEVIEEYGTQWVLFSAGNGKIGLHRMGDQYLAEVGEGYKFDNNSKIVFAIEDDIKKVRQLLVDHGIAMREIKTFDNYDYWLCDGEDPEGNVFQLKQTKPTE